jgi:adenosylcobinamide-GDP ribazoletransferase
MKRNAADGLFTKPSHLVAAKGLYRRNMLRSMLTAFRTLTILPLPGRDTKDLSRTLFFFPLVGAFLGLLVIALLAGAEGLGFPYPPVIAALSVALITWLTGCLHVDGIGDVADAFGAGKGKERILDLLKDPRMGSFGVTAIVLDLLIKVWCWQFFFTRREVAVVVWSFAFARSMQGLIITFLPNARPASTAGPFRVDSILGKVSMILSFVGTGVVAAYVSSVMAALVFAASSLLVSAAFAFYCLKKIGGITGDCVGATNELVEVSVLVGGMMMVS